MPPVSMRPGYSGPENGWGNRKPVDLVPGQRGKTLQEMLDLMEFEIPPTLIGGDPKLRNTTKYNYVLDLNGEILVGKAPQFNHHPDLINGQNVLGAGEIYVDRVGNFVEINDQSGHYYPVDDQFGAKFFEYMKYLLQAQGKDVADNIFVRVGG